jgi:hypothetical protein
MEDKTVSEENIQQKWEIWRFNQLLNIQWFLTNYILNYWMKNLIIA